MAVIIPLKMSDGTTVRTIEELRDHFNLADVLGYYDSGRLAKWLSDGFYDEEAEKVKALDSSLEDLGKELCNILGVDYQEYNKVDLKDISNKNERLERLKQYTDDDRILAFVDNVVFTQQELDDLWGKVGPLKTDEDDNIVIYLCGEHFIIPASIGGIIYKGVNNPTVTFDDISIDGVEAGIDLQDLEFDIVGCIVEYGIENASFRDYYSYSKFCRIFGERSSILGMKLLRIAAEKGSDTAQYILGECYFKGDVTKEDYKEAAKWYQKAAEQGNPQAQNGLGHCYYDGKGVPQNYEEAVKWYRKAAEHGVMEAQRRLHRCYTEGNGVEQDYEEASKWFNEAMESQKKFMESIKNY